MTNNRITELNVRRNQLLAEIEAFNLLAGAYGIEKITLTTKSQESSGGCTGYKDLFFSTLSEAKNYLGANGFKSLGTRSYSKGVVVASIDYEYERGKWKVSFQ